MDSGLWTGTGHRLPKFANFVNKAKCRASRMCCMDGCKGIPIFCLPSCFKALFCGQYEDIDGNANRDVKGGEEPPIPDSAVEAAIEHVEAQA